MICKVSAQFDSVDSAETAARSIINSIQGVYKISIRAKNAYASSPNSAANHYIGSGINGAFGVFYPYTFGGNTINSFFNDSENSFDNSDIIGKQAYVEILCDTNSRDMVNKSLVGLGGLRIRNTKQS